MSEQIECIRCRSQMELGYIADLTVAQQNWAPGEPKSGHFKSLKVKKSEFVPVTTLRCPNCGYLESYAIKRV